ncbi:MAG TPA: hypothetical protein VLR27_14240 [Acidimicrobiales bacterium]|nr:hypothetical protein [Acidimicrobiales bacterium]
MKHRLATLAVALVLVLGACESDQDPGIDPGVTDGPAETSDTLGTCPAGGPDDTTPPAGCLGPDGSVLRP